MFLVPFVCLSAELWKTYWPDFQKTLWMGAPGAKGEPLNAGVDPNHGDLDQRDLDPRGKNKNYSSFSLT